MGIFSNGKAAWKDIDPSALTIERNPSPPALPETLVWGATFSAHMLVINHVPGVGWSAPLIKPYGPLELSPASACLHYASNLFEGMKAYKTADGDIKLFRPTANMARMRRSAARMALPAFNEQALITLISKLVEVDAAYVPPAPFSLYLRPTMIGTRPTLGVGASEHCMLYVICAPVGPFFPKGFKPVSLLATSDAVRSWPGGTGEYKLALNYSPCFLPQQKAQELGYDQNLWVLNDTVTECGQMNVFVALKDGENRTRLITPPLNGLVLPGVTRDSLLTLARSHAAHGRVVPGLPEELIVEEREFTITELKEWSAAGKILEAFGSGTAAVICPIERIGIPATQEGGKITDLAIAVGQDGLGDIARGLHRTLVAIQEGREEGPEGWSVSCLKA